jgi:hypothetical protein
MTNDSTTTATQTPTSTQTAKKPTGTSIGAAVIPGVFMPGVTAAKSRFGRGRGRGRGSGRGTLPATRNLRPDCPRVKNRRSSGMAVP